MKGCSVVFDLSLALLVTHNIFVQVSRNGSKTSEGTFNIFIKCIVV